MVVGEEEVDGPEVTGKKKKVYKWSDRSPEDCLVHLVQFTGTLIDRMDERYESSVTDAAHHLQKFLYIPWIYALFEGSNRQGLTGAQRAKVYEYGQIEFTEFFQYVCSLPHIVKACEANPALSFFPALGNSVYDRFKRLIYEVVFHNAGNCRSKWFPPTDALCKHGTILLRFSIERCPCDLDDTCLF